MDYGVAILYIEHYLIIYSNNSDFFSNWNDVNFF